MVIAITGDSKLKKEGSNVAVVALVVVAYVVIAVADAVVAAVVVAEADFDKKPTVEK